MIAAAAYYDKNVENSRKKLQFALICDVIGILSAIIFLFVYIIFIATILNNLPFDKTDVSVLSNFTASTEYLILDSA